MHLHCSMCTLKQVILLEKIFLLFVLPGNIYHQLSIVQESILLLNMLGQIMLPVNRVLKRSKIQKG